MYAHPDHIRALAFGNHRKFEEKNDPKGLYNVIMSFVDWIEASGGHPAAAFETPGATTPQARFEDLYHRLERAKTLSRIGRTARFDLLDLIGRLDLIEVEPNSTYIADSTGPLRGALKLCRLPLHDRSKDTRAKMELVADDLAKRLGAPYAVTEDALCCWQK